MIAQFDPPKIHPRGHRSDAIVSGIRQWIVSKNLQPGDRLPIERDLVELFRSSRGTVREALKILESQGLIEILTGPKGGARIASVSHERTSQFLRNFLYFKSVTWSQVYAIREKIEPMVAGSVVDLLTSSDLAELKDTVAICRAGITGEVSHREHRAAELKFHAILGRSCPDPMLRFFAEFITDLLVDFTQYRNVIEPLESEFAVTALKYHIDLIDAFEKRDKAEVIHLMEQHMHDSGCIICNNEIKFDDSLLLNTAES